MSSRPPHTPIFQGNTAVSAVDWLGNRFHVGERVIYCIGAGRGQMMAIGEVIKIKVEATATHRRDDCESDDPEARPYPNDSSRFWKYVDYIREDVLVQVKTMKTSGRWDNEERSKPAWVNPMNITAWPQVEKP